jgi:hypothetical protein
MTSEKAAMMGQTASSFPDPQMRGTWGTQSFVDLRKWKTCQLSTTPISGETIFG